MNRILFLLMVLLCFTYAQQKENGVIKKYYNNGKIHTLYKYKNGCPIDTGFEYYDNGKISTITIFLKCDSVYTYESYYENGDIQIIESLNSKKTYFTGNKLRSSTNYRKKYNKEGLCTEYFENGQPKDSALYKEDKTVWSKSFFSTGKLRLYYKEIKDGKILEGYSYSPKSKITGSIKNGNGTLLIYHGDGTGPDTMTFKDGEDEW